MVSRVVLISIAVVAAVAATLPTTANAAPYDREMQGGGGGEYDDPELALLLLSRLLHTNALESLIRGNTKRGLDLGLGRGFSGSQAAKQRMGLSAANFAGGPGRRKRNILASDAVQQLLDQQQPSHLSTALHQQDEHPLRR